MTNRCKMQNCENCSKEIFEGDLGMWGTDSCLFCADCAPKLSDKIHQHQEVIKSKDEATMLELGYVDFAAMEHRLGELDADLMHDGDSSLAVVL